MSAAQPIPVLFTHYGDQSTRGGEQLLLDLMGQFDPAAVRPIVWTDGTEMAAAARTAGFPTYHTDFAYYLDAGSPAPNPFRYAGFVRQGLALVRRHGVRVIHANSAAPVQWVRRWRGFRGAGCSCICAVATSAAPPWCWGCATSILRWACPIPCWPGCAPTGWRSGGCGSSTTASISPGWSAAGRTMRRCGPASGLPRARCWLWRSAR